MSDKQLTEEELWEACKEHGCIPVYHNALLSGLEAAKGCISAGYMRMAVSNLQAMIDQFTEDSGNSGGGQ